MNVNEVRGSAWYRDLAEAVEREYQAIQAIDESRRPALEAEQARLNEQIAGWAQSLAKRDLDVHVRSLLENKAQEAGERLDDIGAALTEETAHQQVLQSLIDPQAIASRLDRLDQVLAAGNASLINLELSLNIDRIDCFSDGKVTVRTCRLGPLADSIDLLKTTDDHREGILIENKNRRGGRVSPRRRAKLRTANVEEAGDELAAAAEFAADPDRFAGLAERWFCTDFFVAPGKKKSWAEKHAAEVARLRMENRSIDEIAQRLGKTPPTIRRALAYADSIDEFAGNLPAKVERRRWHEEHAAEVAAYKAQGLTTDQIAEHLHKSDTTIRKALLASDQASSEGRGRNLDTPGHEVP